MFKYDILFIGGHHTSSIPIIIEFLNQRKKIVFVGHKYANKEKNNVSSEYKEISSLKIPFIDFAAPKFYCVPGVYKYFFLIKSLFSALILLILNRPKVVISFGGYMAVPLIICARLLNIKTITHEQTTTIGLANKIISFFVNKILLTWDTSLKYYKNKKNTYVVGLPIRSEIIAVPEKKLNKNYKLKKLYVQGGKQGSHIINQFIFDNIDELCKKYTIYHQTSINSANNDYEISKQLSNKYQNRYFSFDFLYGKEYSNVLRNCDFIISRSGAHIVYEISYLKIPAIFIPIPWVSQNEQYNNALVAKKYTPCVIVEEEYLSLLKVLDSIKNLESEIANQKNYLSVNKNSLIKICKLIDSFL